MSSGEPEIDLVCICLSVYTSIFLQRETELTQELGEPVYLLLACLRLAQLGALPAELRAQRRLHLGLAVHPRLRQGERVLCLGAAMTGDPCGLPAHRALLRRVHLRLPCAARSDIGRLRPAPDTGGGARSVMYIYIYIYIYAIYV